jgi:hypothetical protein
MLRSPAQACTPCSYRDNEFPDEEQTILRKYVLELARCQLSQQKFTQPRFLHCMHCFSYKAIAPFAENGLVVCPSCQFETKLGPEGLQARAVLPVRARFRWALGKRLRAGPEPRCA